MSLNFGRHIGVQLSADLCGEEEGSERKKGEDGGKTKGGNHSSLMCCIR